MVNRRIRKGKKTPNLFFFPLEVFLVKEQGLQQVKFQVKIKTVCMTHKQCVGSPLTSNHQQCNNKLFNFSRESTYRILPWCYTWMMQHSDEFQDLVPWHAASGCIMSLRLRLMPCYGPSLCSADPGLTLC